MHYLPEISVIVNFLLLAGGLFYVSRKPAISFFQERSQTIRKNVEESERLHQEALDLVRSYKKKLDGLDAEVTQMIEYARSEGEREKRQIIARAEKLSAQMIDNAKASVAREVDRQKALLEQELMSKVVAQAIEVLKQKATEKDHQQFTQAFISQMEKSYGKLN